MPRKRGLKPIKGEHRSCPVGMLGKFTEERMTVRLGGKERLREEERAVRPGRQAVKDKLPPSKFLL